MFDVYLRFDYSLLDYLPRKTTLGFSSNVSLSSITVPGIATRRVLRWMSVNSQRPNSWPYSNTLL